MYNNVKDFNTFRRIYKHQSTEFPFELAHANDLANNMGAFHWHDFLEITYVLSGKGVYYIEDKKIPVEAGDFLIINNIERHRVQYERETPLYETVLHFDAAILQTFIHDGCNLFDYNGAIFHNKLELNDENREQLISILDTVVEEFREKKDYYELCIISQLTYFISLALRYCDVHLLTAPESDSRSSNIARLENILKYLSAHLDQETTLKSVAKRFFLNPTYFSEYFKKMMGVTFTEYMRELRISRAVQLLEQDNMRIVDIAFACGFSSTSAFYEAFSRVHGIPPQKYMSQKKRNLNR